MKNLNEEKPPVGKWCWVSNGKGWLPAFLNESGQFTNGDTWYDFEHDHVWWELLPDPPSPSEEWG